MITDSMAYETTAHTLGQKYTYMLNLRECVQFGSRRTTYHCLLVADLRHLTYVMLGARFPAYWK